MIEEHANPTLAHYLRIGEFSFKIVELVEVEFSSQRHLRSFLLGRESYWISLTKDCINIAKPERPILDLYGIQARLSQLQAELASEKTERDKTRGYGERGIKQLIEKANVLVLGLEKALRDKSTLKIFGLRVPKSLRTEIPKELLVAQKIRDDARRSMDELFEKRRKCESRMELIETEIFAQRFIGFQCGISISSTDWEPLGPKDW